MRAVSILVMMWNSLGDVGVNAILVGESLMRSPDIGEQVRKLIG